jgi:hypothetical protein
MTKKVAADQGMVSFQMGATMFFTNFEFTNLKVRYLFFLIQTKKS